MTTGTTTLTHKSGKRLLVTVLSGFLGADKITLLNHDLTSREGLKVGIIVNDSSELKIHEALVKTGAANLSRTDGKLVKMQNRCICCTFREARRSARRMTNARPVTASSDHTQEVGDPLQERAC